MSIKTLRDLVRRLDLDLWWDVLCEALPSLVFGAILGVAVAFGIRVGLAVVKLAERACS